MKKITKLDDYQPVEIMKDTFESRDMVLRGVVEKTNELVDFANSHQEEHEGLLDAIKTVYAPETRAERFSSGDGTSQPKNSKADKVADIIRDYAHDYRSVSLDEDNFRVMLQDFLKEIETL